MCGASAFLLLLYLLTLGLSMACSTAVHLPHIAKYRHTEVIADYICVSQSFVLVMEMTCSQMKYVLLQMVLRHIDIASGLLVHFCQILDVMLIPQWNVSYFWKYSADIKLHAPWHKLLQHDDDSSFCTTVCWCHVCERKRKLTREGPLKLNTNLALEIRNHPQDVAILSFVYRCRGFIYASINVYYYTGHSETSFQMVECIRIDESLTHTMFGDMQDDVLKFHISYLSD